MARTVLVVDDHAAFRAAARRLLELDGLRVVGEAEDGATALRLVPVLAPDIVLLDVGLPDLSGFEVADRLADGPAQVVFVSSRAPGDLGRRVRST
ncbi:MAG TPA: response regulator, partial [Solirubrobacteraceae bacterium]|nr:response regulator [Solirubrobacteraceae bacterium]